MRIQIYSTLWWYFAHYTVICLFQFKLICSDVCAYPINCCLFFSIAV